MILYAFIVLSIILLLNKNLALRGILIFSLAIPTSFDSTSFFSINIGGFNFLYTDLLVGIAIIVWILTPNTNPIRSKFIKNIKIVIYILIYLTIVGVLKSLLLFENVSQILYDSRPIFYYIMIIISMDVFSSEKDMIKISKSILLGLTIYCVFTLSYFIYNIEHPLHELFSIKAIGFNNRIAFHNDIYFLFGFPILIYLTKRSSLSKKSLYLFLLILFMAQLIVTMSRTLFVLSILSVIFSFYKVNKKSFDSNFSLRVFFKVIRQFVFTITFIVFSFYLFFPNLIGDSFLIFYEYSISRYTGLFEDQYSAHVLPRINLIEAGIEQIINAPIFGHGFGHFFTVKGWIQKLSFIDNSFVTLWIRIGLVGIFIFSLIFFYYFKVIAVYKKLKIINNNKHIQALISSAPIALSLILINCINVSFLVNSTAVLPLCIILGSTIGFWTREIVKSNN
jgi:hypothetical protein